MGGKDRGGRGRRRGGLIHGRGEQDVAREASAHSAPTGGRRKTIKGDFLEKPLEFSEFSQLGPFPIKTVKQTLFSGPFCKQKIWQK